MKIRCDLVNQEEKKKGNKYDRINIVKFAK